MLMGGAVLKWIVVAVTVALMVGGFARPAAAAVAPDAALPVASAAASGRAPVAAPGVIPAPAHVESRSGAFAISASTRLVIPRDPRAARAARYFADLLQKTRGIQLATGESGADHTAH